MRALLSAALVLTSVFAANINTSIKETESILNNIKKTQKDLSQKIEINYITKNDLNKINQTLTHYQSLLTNIQNTDFKNVSPKDIEVFSQKVAELSKKINAFANDVFTIAKNVKDNPTKVNLVANAIVKINSIANNLENVSNDIPVSNLPANVQGNVILAQSTITENSMNLQQKAQDMAQTLVKNANKFSSKISQSKEDELTSASHESLKQEKQKEEDDKNNNNNNQNPLMMLMGGMMQNSPMGNNPMMQKMMQNSPMSGGGMDNSMMGGMMQNAPMMNAVGGMMGGQ